MRNKLLVAAVVLVGLASVAYAAFSQLLTITGTGTATGDWDVKITGITKKAGSIGATDKGTTPSFTGTTATFDVDLAYPGSTATYDITIANTGSIGAKLSSITDLTTTNAASPADIKFTLTGVQVDDPLVAETGTTTATVKVEWLGTATTNITSESKTATIEFNYTQNT